MVRGEGREDVPRRLSIIEGERCCRVCPQRVGQGRQFFGNIGAKSLSLVDSKSHTSQNDRKDGGRQDQQSQLSPNRKISENHALSSHGFLSPPVQPGPVTAIRSSDLLIRPQRD